MTKPIIITFHNRDPKKIDVSTGTRVTEILPGFGAVKFHRESESDDRPVSVEYPASLEYQLIQNDALGIKATLSRKTDHVVVLLIEEKGSHK